jgi:hypothetical protein
MATFEGSLKSVATRIRLSAIMLASCTLDEHVPCRNVRACVPAIAHAVRFMLKERPFNTEPFSRVAHLLIGETVWLVACVTER